MNKKFVRSFVAVILTLIMMVGALPLSVFADETDGCSAVLLPDETYEDLTEPFLEETDANSIMQDDDSADLSHGETYEDTTEMFSEETNESSAVQDGDSETLLPNDGLIVPLPEETEKESAAWNNEYPIMPMAAITDIIDPSYRIVGFDVHGSGSDTTYTVKGGTWLYDGGNNALFCSEWEDLAPNDKAKIQFYGLMEDYESGLSFSAAWAYKCIKGAKGIWNDSA